MSIFHIYCNENHHKEFLKYQAFCAMLRKIKRIKIIAPGLHNEGKKLEVYYKEFWQHCVCFQWYFCLYWAKPILYHYMYQLQSLLSIYWEQKFYLLAFHTICYINRKLQEETKCLHSINLGKFQPKNQYLFSQGF